MRVVLDTNILISACWTPGGLEDITLSLALAGEITPCVSSAVLAEYRDVVSRPKFKSRRDRMEELLRGIELQSLHVEPQETITLAADEDDNRFLECASAASAEFLITGNLRHYPELCGLTQIVNARSFLNHFGTFI